MREKQKKQPQGRTEEPARRPRWLPWVVAGVGALGLIIGVFQSSQSSLESQPLPKRGDQSLLQDVQSFPSEGTEHVSESTEVAYNTSPPTSGRHYAAATPGGFYVEPRPPGNLVHSLEHGAVIIYYDPAKLTDEIRQSLTRFVQAHRDPWASVLWDAPQKRQIELLVVGWRRLAGTIRP